MWSFLPSFFSIILLNLIIFCFCQSFSWWVTFIHFRFHFAFLCVAAFFFFFLSELSAFWVFFFLSFSLCWFSGALILPPESKRMWDQCLVWIYSVLHDIFLLCFCLLQIIMVYKPFQAFQSELYYQTGKIRGCSSFKGTNSLSEGTEDAKIKQ